MALIVVRELRPIFRKYTKFVFILTFYVSFEYLYLYVFKK